MEDSLIDWARAVKVGAIGFGITFIVLVTLAVAIWLTGFLVGKTGLGKDKAGNQEKED